jgi:hypothetical protein
MTCSTSGSYQIYPSGAFMSLNYSHFFCRRSSIYVVCTFVFIYVYWCRAKFPFRWYSWRLAVKRQVQLLRPVLLIRPQHATWHLLSCVQFFIVIMCMFVHTSAVFVVCSFLCSYHSYHCLSICPLSFGHCSLIYNNFIFSLLTKGFRRKL